MSDRRGGLPPTDLAGAFGRKVERPTTETKPGTGRSSGLQSRLGPSRGLTSRDETQAADPSDGEHVDDTRMSPTVDSGAKVQAGTRDEDQAPHDSTQVTQPADGEPTNERTGRDRRGAVVIYISTALRERINDYLEETGVRNADLLFDALEATAEELPQLWADSLRSPHAQGRSLFSRDSAPQRSGVEPQIGWYVAMSPANQAVLDDLVKQVTGGSSRKRSALTVLALSTYLAKRKAGD